MSEDRAPLRCRLGWHKWTKWEDAELTVRVRPRIFFPGEPSAIEKRRGQKRRCLCCNIQTNRIN